MTHGTQGIEGINRYICVSASHPRNGRRLAYQDTVDGSDWLGRAWLAIISCYSCLRSWCDGSKRVTYLKLYVTSPATEDVEGQKTTCLCYLATATSIDAFVQPFVQRRGVLPAQLPFLISESSGCWPFGRSVDIVLSTSQAKLFLLDPSNPGNFEPFAVRDGQLRAPTFATTLPQGQQEGDSIDDEQAGDPINGGGYPADSHHPMEPRHMDSSPSPHQANHHHDASPPVSSSSSLPAPVHSSSPQAPLSLPKNPIGQKTWGERTSEAWDNYWDENISEDDMTVIKWTQRHGPNSPPSNWASS